MKILYIGPQSGNSKFHIDCLKKNSKNIDVLNIEIFFRKFRFLSLIFYNISPKIFEIFINIYLKNRIKNQYDLIYVISAEFLGINALNFLKKKTKKIFFYCADNPFVKRDKKRWTLFLSVVNQYDKIFFIQQSRLKYKKKYNSNNFVIKLPPYEKKIHKKRNLKKIYDVVFVGTWLDTRGIFVNYLLKNKINLKVFGTRWEKDRFYKINKSNIILGNLKPIEYSNIINKAKIAICLFSKENEDNITTRSSEIPAIGTFMLSYKSNYQKKILRDKKEVVYFNNFNDCVQKCHFYLKETNVRKKIASQGMHKIREKLNISYEDLIKDILRNV